MIENRKSEIRLKILNFLGWQERQTLDGDHYYVDFKGKETFSSYFNPTEQINDAWIAFEKCQVCGVASDGKGGWVAMIAVVEKFPGRGGTMYDHERKIEASEATAPLAICAALEQVIDRMKGTIS